MNEWAKKRLAELEQQIAVGGQAIAELEARLKSARETVLRIEGAAQVVREMIAESDRVLALAALAAEGTVCKEFSAEIAKRA